MVYHKNYRPFGNIFAIVKLDPRLGKVLEGLDGQACGTVCNGVHSVYSVDSVMFYNYVTQLLALNKAILEAAVYSKILILRFPKTEVQKPLVCNLARDFDLVFNILNAGILPRKEGYMVLELSGTRKNFKDGIHYLKSQGVDVQNASREVKRDDDICTHCGSCTAVCPTGALSIKRPKMAVSFDLQKCSVCELCVPACPTRAMKVKPTKQTFF